MTKNKIIKEQQKKQEVFIAAAVCGLLAAIAASAMFLHSSATDSKRSSQSASSTSSTAHSSFSWPPQLNSAYPELELMSSNGKRVKLSSYAGKVILIEPIGMSCPACQAFAGADKKGGFGGGSPQTGLPSIDTMLAQNGISPTDSRLMRVQLLLYSPGMTAPTLEQAQAWSKHFGFGQGTNELILFGDARFINNASYNMIPGFQLVDKSFVLRCDATGHNPKNDLYRELLPMLKRSLQ